MGERSQTNNLSFCSKKAEMKNKIKSMRAYNGGDKEIKLETQKPYRKKKTHNQVFAH